MSETLGDTVLTGFKTTRGFLGSMLGVAGALAVAGFLAFWSLVVAVMLHGRAQSLLVDGVPFFVVIAVSAMVITVTLSPAARIVSSLFRQAPSGRSSIFQGSVIGLAAFALVWVLVDSWLSVLREYYHDGKWLFIGPEVFEVPFTIITNALAALVLLTWFAARGLRGSVRGKPYLLFLRNFDLPSDSSIIACLTRYTPSHMGLCFVSPPLTRTRFSTWDSLSLGLSGWRPWRALAGLPGWFRFDDTQWEAQVSRLIQSASIIVIDVSTLSEPLKRELADIKKHGKERVVIHLHEENAEQNTQVHQGVVRYPIGRSLQPINVTMAVLCAIGYVLLNFLVGAGNTMSGTPYTLQEQLLLEFMFGAPMLGFLAFLKRPRLTRTAREQIRHAINDIIRTR
jgi:hypothetical protein